MLGTILSAVSTVLLVSFSILVYIVVKRLDINLIWELEYYLEVNNYQAPTRLVRAVNKTFASQEEKQKQLDLIHSCQANERGSTRQYSKRSICLKTRIRCNGKKQTMDAWLRMMKRC